MNIGALLAGWPFAILLLLYGRRASQAPLCGIVREKDHRSKALVLERDGLAYPVQINVTTMMCGVDGYPVSLDDIFVGDHVEIVQ
jgi:hypothetical protein